MHYHDVCTPNKNPDIILVILFHWHILFLLVRLWLQRLLHFRLFLKQEHFFV